MKVAIHRVHVCPVLNTSIPSSSFRVRKPGTAAQPITSRMACRFNPAWLLMTEWLFMLLMLRVSRSLLPPSVQSQSPFEFATTLLLCSATLPFLCSIKRTVAVAKDSIPLLSVLATFGLALGRVLWAIKPVVWMDVPRVPSRHAERFSGFFLVSSPQSRMIA